MKIIAMQGIKGCFHHIAALRYFDKNSFKALECNSFIKLVEALISNKANLGIMAIENSIAGSILTNYNLLSEYDIKILGEIYIPIEQHLMAIPGKKVYDLREIFSHPVALQQCTSFLNEHSYIKTSEYSDTAEAARDIMKKKWIYAGAIASEQAAQEYGLEILARNVHSVPNNYTRFFIISSSKQQKPIDKFDKASLKFKIHHKTGSLSKLLNIISEENINMSKIQSAPILGNPRDYSFYIDLMIENIIAYERIKSKLKKQMWEFSVLGEYKRGCNS